MVLSSVKFKKDGYIYFDTPETFVNGNVVIVAIDKELGYDQIEADADKRITNAEVLWSWNIVFSEGYDPDAAENWIVKGGYTWMNRDLGALIDPEQAYIGGQLNNVALASTTGNCYQWGTQRPVPWLAGLYECTSQLYDRIVVRSGLYANSRVGQRDFRSMGPRGTSSDYR